MKKHFQKTLSFFTALALVFSVSALRNFKETQAADYDSCNDWYNAGYTTDGVYQIGPSNQNVYCDMQSDGGGWTVCANLYETSDTTHDVPIYWVDYVYGDPSNAKGNANYSSSCKDLWEDGSQVRIERGTGTSISETQISTTTTGNPFAATAGTDFTLTTQSGGGTMKLRNSEYIFGTTTDACDGNGPAYGIYSSDGVSIPGNDGFYTCHNGGSLSEIDYPNGATIDHILVSIRNPDTFSGAGSGTSGDPYIITTCTQLQEIDDNNSAYYELGNDIDCSSTTYVVSSSVPRFSGELDGQGYKITLGSMSSSQTWGKALFLSTNNATIKNLEIELTQSLSASYTGSGNAISAGLACYTEGTTLIENVKVTTNGLSASQATDAYTAGIVGQLRDSGIIRNSYAINNGNMVTSGSSGNYSGGLVGSLYSSSASIQNSYAINNASLIYGIVHNSVGGTVTNSYCTGSGSGCSGSASDFYGSSHEVYTNNSPTWDFTAIWQENASDFPTFKEPETRPAVVSGIQDWSGEADTSVIIHGTSGTTTMDTDAHTMIFNTSQTADMSEGSEPGVLTTSHDGTTVGSALNALSGATATGVVQTVLANGTGGTTTTTTLKTGTTEVVFEDNTTLYADQDWDSSFIPPYDNTSGLTFDGKEIYSGISLGLSDKPIVMDKPAKIILGSTGGDPYFKHGTGSWTAIDVCTDADETTPGSLAFPDSCYYEYNGDTIIWTHHFSDFGDAGPLGGGGSAPQSTTLEIQVSGGNIEIGAPSTIDFGAIATDDTQFEIQLDMETYNGGSDYFTVNDMKSADAGYYVNLGIGDMISATNTISADNFKINLDSRSVSTLAGTSGGAPIIPSIYSDPGSGDQSFSSEITVISRDYTTSGQIGNYGIQPLIKLTVPAYTSLGSYTATMTYTLIEN